MYSQIDIRYRITSTVSAVRAITNAFPGDIALCLENHILYQYVEYEAGTPIPADDGLSCLQTTDQSLFTRWISIEQFNGKCLSGSIGLNDWELDTDGEHYLYTILLPNKLNRAIVKFYDSNFGEFLPERIEYVNSTGLTSIKVYIGAIPDCRFDCTYSIFFDRLI